MKYDSNVLERSAAKLIADGKHREALNIYFFMSDGDPSLDGGYLGEVIARCYEALGELQVAKYWYGRAVEENPEVRKYSAEARKRLEYISIDHLISS